MRIRDRSRPKPDLPAGPRMNDCIRISPVKVVNQDGTMLGEMPTADAQLLAKDAGLDLVEVSDDTRPPICRIMPPQLASAEP